MIQSLYEQFKKWSNTGSVYIISDTHFMNEDMNWRWILIKDYPFVVTDNLADEKEIAHRITEYLVWKINKVVTKNDTLIVLGDIGDVEYIKRIKAGYKVLIKGNHDSGNENYKRKVFYYNACEHYDYCGLDISCDACSNNKERKKDNKLFDEVYEGPLFISDKILLSHEPIIVVPPCCLNIHGHTHIESGCTDNSDGFLCVCCEQVNFTPINLGEYIKNGIISDINSIHRFTIDRATTNKKNKEKNI